MECLIKTGATWFGHENMFAAQSDGRIGCSLLRKRVELYMNLRSYLFTLKLLAKAGMRRPNPEEPHGTESNKKQHFPKNDAKPVPEISGKAKHGKAKVDE